MTECAAHTAKLMTAKQNTTITGVYYSGTQV